MAWEDHVHPHGALEELAPRLWCVRGSLPRSPLPRNMVVYRLADGGLLLHSPVALDPPGTEALEALGTPRILVVPNGMHRADAPVFRERYPDATLCCPAGARKKVEAVVSVDGDDTDVLGPYGITCHAPTGDGSFEHVYELPLDEGVALVATDTLFHLTEHLPGFGGFIARYITASTGFFGVTRLGRVFLMGRTPALRAWLEAQAARSDVRVVTVAHGDCVTEDVSAHLRAAAERL